MADHSKGAAVRAILGHLPKHLHGWCNMQSKNELKRPVASIGIEHFLYDKEVSTKNDEQALLSDHEASDLVEISDVEISDEVVRLYLNNNHHSGSVVWMEMIRNGYRFTLEGWSLSRVAMVVFGSGSTVGTRFDLNCFARERANFCMKNKCTPE
eukprot:scaffold7934_cov59-Attheya_sp.AAC.8